MLPAPNTAVRAHGDAPLVSTQAQEKGTSEKNAQRDGQNEGRAGIVFIHIKHPTLYRASARNAMRLCTGSLNRCNPFPSSEASVQIST